MSFKNHGNRQPQHPGMTANPITKQLKIDHGHDGTNVVIIFSHPIPNMVLSVEQADDLIAKLQNSKAELAKHRHG